MKKYIQITVVLGIFFLLVILRNLRGGDDQQQIVRNVQIPPTQSNDSRPTQNPSNTNTQTYKDGTYTGSVEDAFYGNIQVQAVISGGKITDVVFLQYPNDNPTSRSINLEAIQFLKSEAIQVQNAQVDTVSGASDSSTAFVRSLSNALQQAS